jgi:hypothetical protein
MTKAVMRDPIYIARFLCNRPCIADQGDQELSRFLGHWQVCRVLEPLLFAAGSRIDRSHTPARSATRIYSDYRVHAARQLRTSLSLPIIVATLATVAQLGVESRGMVLSSRHALRVPRGARDIRYPKNYLGPSYAKHHRIHIYVFYVVQPVFQH